MAIERETIAAALRRTGYDMDAAARELGCSRRTLQNRMRALNMPRVRSGRKAQALPFKRAQHAGVGEALGLAAVAVGVGAVVSRWRRKTSA